MALGIVHQIRYPYYYIKKLKLMCTFGQLERLERRREEVRRQLKDSPLTGRYLERRIDDYTFINFADLILGNPEGAAVNLERIRNSSLERNGPSDAASSNSIAALSPIPSIDIKDGISFPSIIWNLDAFAL